MEAAGDKRWISVSEKTMFCSNCGTNASGNFCWKCGQKLQPPPVSEDGPIEIRDFQPPASNDGNCDWSFEVNYKKLISHPDVRDQLVMAGNRAKTRMTGEEFLGKFDSVVPGASVVAIAVQPLYEKLGIASSKSATRRFDMPIGKVLVSILCTLAEGGNKLRNVQQVDDGCLFEASIPSDVWSFEGVLLIQVHRQGRGTHVEAATKIPGQFFDWGKSQRLLDQLINGIPKAA
jgi:hypothetical protein